MKELQLIIVASFYPTCKLYKEEYLKYSYPLDLLG